MKRILVSEGAGNVGREVVSQLSAPACHCAHSNAIRQITDLPRHTDAVGGDLIIAETLDEYLAGVDVVFLVRGAPRTAVGRAPERMMRDTRSSNGHSLHELAGLHAEIERLI